MLVDIIDLPNLDSPWSTTVNHNHHHHSLVPILWYGYLPVLSFMLCLHNLSTILFEDAGGVSKSALQWLLNPNGIGNADIFSLNANLKSQQPPSVVLSSEEAGELLIAAQTEEAMCQTLKSRSEKQLEDATAQLAEAEKRLFNAQLNLGRVRYILRRSKYRLPEPGKQDRLRRVFEVVGRECFVTSYFIQLIIDNFSRYSFNFSI
jgi:hypothetical protein